MSDLNRRGAGWQQTAECPKCGVHWRLQDSRLKSMLKMFFLGFPLTPVSLGFVGWGLEKYRFSTMKTRLARMIIYGFAHFRSWALPSIYFGRFSYACSR
jgi:hypothetical protein